MSDSEKKEDKASVINFNMQISGQGHQVNAGERVEAKQVHNHGGKQQLDPKELLKMLREDLQKEIPQDMPKIEEEFFVPAEEFLQQESLPEDPEEQESLKSRSAQIIEKVKPYLPFARQTIAAFAEGALVAACPPPAGWLVGGLLEVIRQNRAY